MNLHSTSGGPLDATDHSGVPGQVEPIAWEQLQTALAGKCREERLELLVDGDPLDLLGRARRWLAKASLLHDVEPFMLRACAAIACRKTDESSKRVERTGSLDEWLEPVFERCSDILHARDQQLVLAGARCSLPLSARFLFLHAVLGIRESHLRSACLTLNALPRRERDTFHGLFVQGMLLSEFARTHNTSIEAVRRDLRDALAALNGATCTAQSASYEGSQAPRMPL